jgi:cysteinyl-tRNA synthetase
MTKLTQNLNLTNTLSGQTEQFSPLNNTQVLMYVCGITPYDYAHIGHGRCYVTFDLLLRLLKLLNYKVTYCRNFTDIDDKLLNRAIKEFGDQMRYPEIAQRYIQAYQQDMQNLNCLAPDIEPLVTQTIPEIISLITKLINNQKAYVIDGDVYYAVDQFPDYGKLSKRNLADLQAGARVEIDTRKRNPLDFALWKSEPENNFWLSPWGWGRPGWHIECSAMAAKHLGAQIDIHGGGMDLIFPHHENEIAQSEGVFPAPFAKYWVHNAFVRINKEKMSKSLDNFFTLQDIFKQFDPMVLRYHFVKHNYSAPLDFSFADLEIDRKTYQKLCKTFAQIETNFLNQEITTQTNNNNNNSSSSAINTLDNKKFNTVQAHNLDLTEISQSPIAQKMLDFLCQDLNTSGLFGVLYENLETLRTDLVQFVCVKQILQNILGLTLAPLVEPEILITPEIQALIDQRILARQNKNWVEADRLRDQLMTLGIELQDKN